MTFFALLALLLVGVFFIVKVRRRRQGRSFRTAADPAAQGLASVQPTSHLAPSGFAHPESEYESSTTLQSFAAISRRDPNFDVEDFLTQASDLYMRVDAARRSGAPQDGERIRPEIGDSAWSVLALDRPGPVKSSTAVLDEPRVAHASTGTVDNIVVRFTDSRADPPAVQDWTFQRPSTAVTVKPGDLRCAKCGAVDSLNAEGRCRYCGTRPAGLWRVTRVADVSQSAVPAHVRSAADLVEALEVLSQRQTATPSRPARPPSLSSRFGCLFVFLLMGAVIGLGLYGWLAPRSVVHGVVGTFLPGTRRAKVAGEVTLQGGLPASAHFNLWWPSPVRCSRLSEKDTAASFSFAVPGNSAVTTKFETFAPIGTGPRDLHDMTVIVSLHGPDGTVQEWTTVQSSTARFVMAEDGSGEASFAGLSPAFPGGSQVPLSGGVKWTCSDH